MHLFDRRRAWATGLLGVAVAACGSPARPASVARTRPRPPIGALHTLAPTGSSLVVVARPTQLMGADATRRVASAVFPEAQLDRFAARTGVDPRDLEELVIAKHEDGDVVLARGPIDAAFAVREAGERMAPLESSLDAPLVRRAGFLGGRRVDLSAIGPEVVLWVEGTPQLAARVLSAAQRAPADRSHALDGGAARHLHEAFAEAPFVAYAPLPLGLPRTTGIGMLLARERAMGVSAEAVDGATLHVRAELLGEFPPGAHDNFRALAHSLAESELGAALGADDALPTLRIEAADERVALSAQVRAAVLVAGLRAVLVAEIGELLELDAPPP